MNVYSPYFKLDVDFEIDNKIIRLLARMGNQGLGVYIRLVALAYRDIINANELDIIAHYIGETEEYIKQILENFGLFYKKTNEEGIEYYTSKRIEFEISEIEQKSKKAKVAGQASAQARRKNSLRQEIQEGLNSTVQTTLECDENIKEFIKDYKKYKNKDFSPSKKERENISIILTDLGEYDSQYWQTVFKKSKAGFKINGEFVPCSLTKILLEHNAIYRDEANLQKSSELEEEKKETAREKRRQEQSTNNQIVEDELKKRQQAREQIKTTNDAVKYLNTYVSEGLMVRQISADYKELKEIFPIALNKESGEYYATS